MHRCFYETPLCSLKTVIVEGEEAFHISKVLRLAKGDFIEIANGNGKVFSAEILSSDKKSVEVLVKEELETNPETNTDVTLFIGLTKSSKLELIIQKATELGATAIVPVDMERSVVKLKDEDKKTERYRRIAFEAVKQCKRTKVPYINTPVDFKTAVDMLKKCDVHFAPYESENDVSLKEFLNTDKTNKKSIGFIIGPEGGFAPEEIELLKENKIDTITLGKRILRMETAAISVLTIVMYEFNEMGDIRERCK